MRKERYEKLMRAQEENVYDEVQWVHMLAVSSQEYFQ